MPTDTQNRRAARACTNCNLKKIRCRFAAGPGSASCDSCLALEVECVSRNRKKRRTVLAQAQAQLPPSKRIHDSQLNVNGEQILPYQYWQSGRSQWRSTGSQLAIEAEEPPQIVTEPWTSQPHEPVIADHDASYANDADTREVGPTPDLPHITSAIPSETIPSNSTQNSAQIATYMGRSHYLAHDIPIDESSARAYHSTKATVPSDTTLPTLQLWESFLLPPRPVRDSLIATFMQRCHLWTPLVLPHDLCSFTALQATSSTVNPSPTSLLLSQSLFLAASRVSSAPGVARFASSAQFYSRAKALFWCGYEKDPITVIAASVLLHWYNPDGPEHVSFDTSRFWLSIGVGLAYQVGLHREPVIELEALEMIKRRRLWWSLVARDCLISSGQGRPRTLNLKDSDVRPPCLDDFPDSNAQGQLFIYYVEICILLGDLTECRSRKHLSRSKKLYLENALFRWIRTLPDSLSLSHVPNSSGAHDGSVRSFNARQLHLPYLITLTIMARSMSSYPPKQDTGYTTHGNISPIAIIASSFVAGIFEEFLARDELQFLGPIFTFYLLAAGIALVSTRRYPNIWPIAQQDLEILQSSLQELSKRWPSATGALKAMGNVIERALSAETSSNPNTALPTMDFLTAERQLLFQGFPFDLCRLWTLYEKQSIDQSAIEDLQQQTNESTEMITAEILGNLRYPASARPDDVPGHIEAFGDPIGEADTSSLTNCQYEGIGNWLLADWEGEPPW